jgi:hypothetical protein
MEKVQKTSNLTYIIILILFLCRTYQLSMNTVYDKFGMYDVKIWYHCPISNCWPTNDILYKYNVEIIQNNGFTNTPIWMWELDFNKTAWKKNCDGRPKFLRSVTGYTICDHKQHKEIKEKTEYMQLKSMTVDCRCKQTQHLLRMHDTFILKLLYEYMPTDRRNVGWPRKR